MRLQPWVLLLLCATVLGWLNYHAREDVQPVAAGLLVAGFGFSFWRPKLAWLLVPLLWLSIPVSGALADAHDYHPGLVRPHPLYETLVALLPTAMGAAAGIGIRWATRSSASGRQP